MLKSSTVCICCGFDTALFYAVENNCGYHLFESDSEEEEDDVAEKKEEEEPTKKKSAFQVRARKAPEGKKLLTNERDTFNAFYRLNDYSPLKVNTDSLIFVHGIALFCDIIMMCICCR